MNRPLSCHLNYRRPQHRVLKRHTCRSSFIMYVKGSDEAVTHSYSTAYKYADHGTTNRRNGTYSDGNSTASNRSRHTTTNIATAANGLSNATATDAAIYTASGERTGCCCCTGALSIRDTTTTAAILHANAATTDCCSTTASSVHSYAYSTCQRCWRTVNCW